jgi:hypothetical protein
VTRRNRGKDHAIRVGARAATDRRTSHEWGPRKEAGGESVSAIIRSQPRSVTRFPEEILADVRILHGQMSLRTSLRSRWGISLNQAVGVLSVKKRVQAIVVESLAWFNRFGRKEKVWEKFQQAIQIF